MWAIIEEALQQPGQDVSGICHDIFTMAKLAIRTATDPELVRFSVMITGLTHALKLHIGLGDKAAPVRTLMLPYED